MNKWIKKNCDDLTGKTIVITGSTGGILTYATKIFATLNANLILVNRNQTKTIKQIDDLKKINPNINIEYVECDLSKFESVKQAVEILRSKHIDILYLASGVYNVKVKINELGFNNIFQTNFLSHYYMVKELLPQLNKVNGQIIAVSSIAHNYSKLDMLDADFSSRKKPSKIYGNSKRFLMFSLYELMKNQQARLKIVHPGITLTNMTNHYHKSINWLVKISLKLTFPSPKKASLNLVKGAFEDTKVYEWIGPKIYNIWGVPKRQKIKNINTLESKNIFNIAEKIYEQIK